MKAIGKYLLMSMLVSSIPALLSFAWSARPLNPEKEYGVVPRGTPEPNAHDIFREAHDVFQTSRVGIKVPALVLDVSAPRGTVEEDPKKYPLAGKVRWVQQNRRGFELFEKALKTDYVFPAHSAARPDGEIDSAYFLRWLAKYVSVECEVLAAQGKPDKAINRAFDIWQMGDQSRQDAPLIVALNAFAVEAVARRALDGEIAHLNGPQARLLARRLEDMLSRRVSRREVLQGERNVMLLQVKRRMETAIRDEKREKEIEAASARGETNFYFDGKPAPELRGPIINWKVRRLSDGFARGMDALLANADAPWSKHQTTLPSDLDETTTKLIGVLDKSSFHFARSDALAQITLARLALHAYRKDKGSYPPTFSALISDYLTKSPTDVFADGRELRYKRSGSRYTLWSVGPDARDDQARAAVNPNARTPQGRYLVAADASGDIVANISR